MRKGCVMLLTGGLAVAAMAADSAASLVFVNPKTSSFWRAAADNVVTLPIAYPEGATAATLAVTGTAYTATYAGITGDTYALTLPAATTAGTENTYALTLTFDNGDRAAAQISVIAGQNDAEGAGSTRCISSGRRSWSRSNATRMTLPIPYGATALTVNGETVDTGLDGAQGFCTVSGLPADLSLTVGEQVYTATIDPMAGFLMIIR